MRRDACNLVAAGLREPDIPIKIRGDAGWGAAGCRDGKLRYLTGSGNTPDVVAALFREPEVAIGIRGESERISFCK
jgi:hypothetical protein